MSSDNHPADITPTTPGNDSGSPVFSTTPTNTPQITPAPLHPVRSSHLLQRTTLTPAPTRHSSVAQNGGSSQVSEANNLLHQGFGNNDNNRASSISAISALSFSPEQLQDHDRNLDRFELSSEDEDEKSARTDGRKNWNLAALGEDTEEPSTSSNRPQNWYTAQPRTPASANTTEAPTSPLQNEIREVSIAGPELVPGIDTSSTRGVRNQRGESVSSSHTNGNRQGSGGTADSGNVQRRGSEARNWEEVHAARRDAAAAVKLVDLTSAAQSQSNQEAFRRYPSTSTQAIKSPSLDINQPRASVDTMNRYASTSTRAMKSPDLGDVPMTPTTAGISPASPTGSLQRYPSSSTRAMKSLAIHTRKGDPTTPKSGKSGSSIATASTSGRAEKGLHVPFLPKFLRLSVTRTSSDTARHPIVTPTRISRENNRRGSASSSAGRKSSTSSSLGRRGSIHSASGSIGRRGSVPVAGNGSPLKSVFEDDDSVEYYGQAQIAHATTATAGRGKVVRQSVGGREVLGLKEILKEDPTTNGTSDVNMGNTSPAKSKVARFLGENVRFGSKRQGIVGVPDVREARENNAVGLGISLPSDSETSYADGLRSNPVRRAATAPARRGRRVTFPPPLIDVATRERERKESIVTTPYPMGYRKKTESLGSPPHEREFGKNMLTLVIYSSQSKNQLPKIKQVILPKPRETVLVDDSHARKPETKATMKEDFDDEKLIRFLTASYRSLRGPLRIFTSARTLVFLHLVSYTDIYALRASPLPPPPATLPGDDVTGLRLQRLLEKPRTGRRQHEVVDFVHQLPGNSEHDLHTSERVAVQFIEGWSVRRIALAIFVVLVLAVLATILWTTLGVEPSFVPAVGGSSGSDNGNGNGTGDGIFGGRTTREMIAGGFRGAGTRVGTGVLLGMLVLGLGWTAVAGWIGLSWLVG